MPSTERREADSSNGKKFRPEDEASYYLGDKFELGGVQFGNSGEAEEKQRNLTRFGEEVWNESDHLGVASTQLSPDDQSVFEKVKMKLAEQEVLDATEVSVEVKQGVVWLGGEVGTREEKQSIQRLIEELPEVRDVMNVIKVRFL